MSDMPSAYPSYAPSGYASYPSYAPSGYVSTDPADHAYYNPSGQPTGAPSGSQNACYNIVYNVTPQQQPTDMSCWATSMSMLITYTEGRTVTPADVANSIGHSIQTGDDNATDAKIAGVWGLNIDGCTCMDVDGWARMLTSYGPLYIGIQGNSHAVLITGLVGDGTNTTFYVNDPARGAQTTTFNRLTELYEDIDNEQEFWIVHR